MNGPEGQNDFFISRTGKDAPWAEWIAWILEEAGYSTYLQDWDFGSGKSFVGSMQEGLTQCRRVIAALSPAYFDSDFSAAEWQAVIAGDPAGLRRRLVTVLVESCQPPGLLTQYPYIDLVGLDEAAARKALLDGIEEGRRKPTSPPVFPGHVAEQHPPFPGAPADVPHHSAPDVPTVAVDSALGEEAITRVRGLLPDRFVGGSTLWLGLAGIPRTPLVRPAQLANKDFARSLLTRALAETPPLLDLEEPTYLATGSRLTVQQQARSLIVDNGACALLIGGPAWEREAGNQYLLGGIIEEDLQARMASGFAFLARLFEEFDRERHVHYLAPVAALTGNGPLGWRTRADRDANPNTMAVLMPKGGELVVHLDPPVLPKVAFAGERSEIVADLAALLRVQVRGY